MAEGRPGIPPQEPVYADPFARIAWLHERVDALKAALAEAVDVAIWMSGSSSFAPEGEAGEHWPKQRERLFEAMKALETPGA